MEQDDDCGHTSFELNKFSKILSDICPSHEEELILKEYFQIFTPKKPKPYILKVNHINILSTELLKKK